MHLAAGGDEADDRLASGVEEPRLVAVDHNSGDVVETIADPGVNDGLEQLDADLSRPGEHHDVARPVVLGMSVPGVTGVHAVGDGLERRALAVRVLLGEHGIDIAAGSSLELLQAPGDGLPIEGEAVHLGLVEDLLSSGVDVPLVECPDDGLLLRRLRLLGDAFDDGTEHGLFH